MQVQRVQQNNTYNPSFKAFYIRRYNGIPNHINMKEVLMKLPTDTLEEIMAVRKLFGRAGEPEATKSFHFILEKDPHNEYNVMGRLISDIKTPYEPFELKLNGNTYTGRNGYINLSSRIPFTNITWDRSLLCDSVLFIKNKYDTRFNTVKVSRYFSGSFFDDPGHYEYSVSELADRILDKFEDLRYRLFPLAKIGIILDKAAANTTNSAKPTNFSDKVKGILKQVFDNITSRNVKNAKIDENEKEKIIDTLLEECGLNAPF